MKGRRASGDGTMTPWEFPWPRILRFLRTEYGIPSEKVQTMTDYELDMWLRKEDELGEGRFTRKVI